MRSVRSITTATRSRLTRSTSTSSSSLNQASTESVRPSGGGGGFNEFTSLPHHLASQDETPAALDWKEIGWVAQADELDMTLQREDAARWALEGMHEGGNDIISEEEEGYPLVIPSAISASKDERRIIREEKGKKVVTGKRVERPTITSPVLAKAKDPVAPIQIPRLALAHRVPIADCAILPYIPFVPALSDPSPQPHHFPLLSRYDWRLSCPLPNRSRHSDRFTPPSLSRISNQRVERQGYNRLIGVGLDPAREGRRWGELGMNDKWGWKVAVDPQQKGEWASHRSWRVGPDRLIQLSRTADEVSYHAGLARLGTPQERELKGKTIIGVVGRWIGSAATSQSMSNEEAKTVAESIKKSEKKEVTGRNPRVYSLWAVADGRRIGKESDEAGSAFVEGSFARFKSMSKANKAAGPLPPAYLQERPPQGIINEVKNGKLLISFEEAWPIGDDEYQLDLGYDDASYKIQVKAIDNLLFDPPSQQEANETTIESAQHVLHTGRLPTSLKEFALLGTELRELLVPSLDASPPASSSSDDIIENSSTTELASLDRSAVPLVNLAVSEALARVNHKSKSTSTAPMNPSKLFKDNQLINSWIKRYGRDKPIKMIGDPEMGLNESQTRAVAMALGESLSLIQGPPGTGKSQTIVSIIHLLKSHFRIAAPILLCAPTHVSIDHLLHLLISRGLNPLRLGKAIRVREDLRKWTVQERAEAHPLYRGCEDFRGTLDELRALIDEYESGKKDLKVASNQKRYVSIKEKYLMTWRKLFAMEQRLYSSLLSTADVFCATALGSSTNRILDMIDFPIVFLDEAAMCTEPVTLVPVMKGASHVTLIGDHMQLPAVVTSKLAQTERLHVSLFERLMAQQSVKSVLLETQYRMRPCISAFPNQAFYNSALDDSATVSLRANPPVSRFFNATPTASVAPGVTSYVPHVFISHECPEARHYQSSVNRGEVNIIVDIVGDLLSRNPTLQAEDIGIISAYAAQTVLLRRTFEQDAGDQLSSVLSAARSAEVSKVEVNTVDGFQGREKSVIIFSTVRSNVGGYIGFLNDKRRLNVALTRAQNALFVVGNERTLRLATTSEWATVEGQDSERDNAIFRKYLNWMKDRGLIRAWKSRNEEEGERAEGGVECM